MQKEKRDKHFIKKPTYPGGRKALQKFIAQNLKYPAEALENNIEGTVNLKYTIDHKGKVIDTHVISGPGYGCNEEAERLARLLKFEIPSQARKVRVTFSRDLHIHFKLPKKKPVQKKSLQLQYAYTTGSSAGKRDDNAANKKSYSYTIKLK